jgi:adenylosuccinate lyase
VLLALIDTGLNRQEAYKMVQRNAMKTWKEGGEFLNILEADAEVTASIPPGELRSFFNYDYYLKHIDEIFNRLG